MSNEKCPLCGNKITSEELQNLTSKLKEESKKAMAAREVELQKCFAKDHETKLAAQRVQLESKSRKESEESRKQVAELTKQVTELTSAQQKFKQQIEKASEEKLKLELEKKKLDSEKALVEQRKILDGKHEKDLAKEKSDRRRENEAMEKKLLGLQRQLEDRSATTIGDGAEIDLYEELRRAFPDDNIERVAKGKSGSDVHHDVMYEGVSCGRIVYESKNCQQWRESFTSKLRKDQIAAGAEHAVLSSTIFPAGQRELFISNDVIVVHPARAIQIGQILRNWLIELAQTSASEQDRSEKTQRLYDFIRSSQFVNRLNETKKYADDLLALEVDYKNQFDRMAKKRGEKITDIKNSIGDLGREISLIIGGEPVAVATNGQPMPADNPSQPR